MAINLEGNDIYLPRALKARIKVSCFSCLWSYASPLQVLTSFFNWSSLQLFSFSTCFHGSCQGLQRNCRLASIITGGASSLIFYFADGQENFLRLCSGKILIQGTRLDGEYRVTKDVRSRTSPFLHFSNASTISFISPIACFFFDSY